MIQILKTMDRLWSAAHGVTPMKKCFVVKTVDLQHKVEDELRDQIELLNLRLEDQKEETERWVKASHQWKVSFGQHEELMQDRNAAVARCTSMESQVKNLQEEVKNQITNRDHFRQLVAEQDKLIKELRTKIGQEKTETERILEARKNEVDHLARQCVRLNEENSTLKTDNCKFTEQTTRLIEENRKLTQERDHYLEQNKQYECYGCKSGEQGSYCGGCLGCLTRQAEHSMHELDKALAKRDAELSHERNVGMYRWQTIEVLASAIKRLGALPFWAAREKRQIINDAQRKALKFQEDVEKMRKEFYKCEPIKL